MAIAVAPIGAHAWKQRGTLHDHASRELGQLQAGGLHVDWRSDSVVERTVRSRQEPSWTTKGHMTASNLKMVFFPQWRNSTHVSRLPAKANQGLDGEPYMAQERLSEDSEASLTVVNVRITHNRAEGLREVTSRPPVSASTRDPQTVMGQSSEEAERRQSDDGKGQQRWGEVQPSNSVEAARWQAGNSADDLAEGGPASPAELAKRRFVMERGYGDGLDAKLGLDGEPDVLASGRDLNVADGRREPMEDQGGPLSRSPGGRLRQPSIAPMKRAMRAPSGTDRDGLPLPSTSIVLLTLGACMVALGMAISRYGSYRSTLPGPPPVAAATAIVKEQFKRQELLGHYKVEEAPLEDLRPVLADKSVQLRSSAAKSFLQMQGAAREDGVYLVPLSGFRSVKDQVGIFYDIKAARNQPVAERARVSAPPGYSEHHTGYALDIGDASAAETHLEFDFEHTEAFHWLQRNANRFHYEMSFPPGNEQGIMYEPWHWRFVGDSDSTHTFYSRQSR